MSEMLENNSDDLPDILTNDKRTIDGLWGLWVIWRAAGKRFLPSQLKEQDEREMAVILELDNIFERLSRQKSGHANSMDGESELE